MSPPSGAAPAGAVSHEQRARSGVRGPRRCVRGDVAVACVRGTRLHGGVGGVKAARDAPRSEIQERSKKQLAADRCAKRTDDLGAASAEIRTSLCRRLLSATHRCDMRGPLCLRHDGKGSVPSPVDRTTSVSARVPTTSERGNCTKFRLVITRGVELLARRRATRPTQRTRACRARGRRRRQPTIVVPASAWKSGRGPHWLSRPIDVAATPVVEPSVEDARPAVRRGEPAQRRFRFRDESCTMPGVGVEAQGPLATAATVHQSPSSGARAAPAASPSTPRSMAHGTNADAARAARTSVRRHRPSFSLDAVRSSAPMWQPPQPLGPGGFSRARCRRRGRRARRSSAAAPHPAAARRPAPRSEAGFDRSPVDVRQPVPAPAVERRVGLVVARLPTGRRARGLRPGGRQPAQSVQRPPSFARRPRAARSPRRRDLWRRASPRALRVLAARTARAPRRAEPSRRIAPLLTMSAARGIPLRRVYSTGPPQITKISGS